MGLLTKNNGGISKESIYQQFLLYVLYVQQVEFCGSNKKNINEQVCCESCNLEFILLIIELKSADQAEKKGGLEGSGEEGETKDHISGVIKKLKQFNE